MLAALHGGLRLEQRPPCSAHRSDAVTGTGAVSAAAAPAGGGGAILLGLLAPWQLHPDSKHSTSASELQGTPATAAAAAAGAVAAPSRPRRRFPPPLPWEKEREELQQQQHSERLLSSQDASTSGRNALRTRRRHEAVDDTASAMCVETHGSRQRSYRVRHGEDDGRAWEGFDMVEDAQTQQGRLLELVHSYLLPQGFPDSVAPQYAQYMAWRGVQYFFGGAMSVFTTQSLLRALGVAGRHAGESAAAINWVLKDGAGRLGRFLFARWGRELDCELKQFRLAGDVLMEAGATLELSTALMPRAFLPLACTANLAKNLAAVAASSTRAPIYRTFALSNNLADVTAKGESVANLADILGTLAGIALSKARVPLVPVFAVLSAGYLVASRCEVDSVQLPYLNRARLAYTSQRFLLTGVVPGVPEANQGEPLLPWRAFHQGRVVLGARVEQACAAPADLRHSAVTYRGERFMLTFRPDTNKVYVLLRQGAQPTDCLKAAFSAHVMLYLLDIGAGGGSETVPSAPAAAADGAAAPAPAVDPYSRAVVVEAARRLGGGGCGAAAAAAAASGVGSGGGGVDARRLLDASKAAVDALYPDFTRQAEKAGWKLNQTMLNPKEPRLVRVALKVA